MSRGVDVLKALHDVRVLVAPLKRRRDVEAEHAMVCCGSSPGSCALSSSHSRSRPRMLLCDAAHRESGRTT
jgi:hypothetical protein